MRRRMQPAMSGSGAAARPVTEMGAVVVPPVPAFCNKPESIDDMIDQVIGRVRRWGERSPDTLSLSSTWAKESAEQPHRAM